MNTERTTRVTLIQKIKNSRNDGAWEEFFQIYRNYIYMVVRNMNVAHHDAEDIVQDVFRKVSGKVKKFEYLREKGKFRHWLCAIAKNTVLDHFRKKKSLPFSVDEGQVASSVEEDVVIPDVEIMAEKEWTNYLANLALEKAREDFEEKTVEYFLAGVRGESIKDIAKKHGVAVNTVYVACARVKRRVREHVRELRAVLL